MRNLCSQCTVARPSSRKRTAAWARNDRQASLGLTPSIASLPAGASRRGGTDEAKNEQGPGGSCASRGLSAHPALYPFSWVLMPRKGGLLSSDVISEPPSLSLKQSAQRVMCCVGGISFRDLSCSDVTNLRRRQAEVKSRFGSANLTHYGLCIRRSTDYTGFNESGFLVTSRA